MIRDPTVDWQLFKAVVKKHLPIISGMALASILFMAFGFFAIIHLSIANPWTAYFFGSIFIAAGLALLILNAKLNGSSVHFYYLKGCLKKRGIELSAVVTGKRTEDGVDKDYLRRSTKPQPVIERDQIVSFRYSVNGLDYDSECHISDASLFNAIEIGQGVSILVLPNRPDIAHPRMKKLKASLLKQDRVPSIEDHGVAIGQDLIDHEL